MAHPEYLDRTPVRAEHYKCETTPEQSDGDPNGVSGNAANTKCEGILDEPQSGEARRVINATR
jgi:hypothetical protein